MGMSKKMEIPNIRFGIIIRKSGETIKYLQLQYGAKIQVTRDTEADLNSTTRFIELIDTDLHQIIRINQGLFEKHCQYSLYQILRGLKHIHPANIIHRDLKPNNLLLNASYGLKMYDFGLARPNSENEFMTEYVVAKWYRAPELLLNSSDYTTVIDEWFVYGIYMELMNGMPLFLGKDHMHHIHLLTELFSTPTDVGPGFVRNVDAR